MNERQKLLALFDAVLVTGGILYLDETRNAGATATLGAWAQVHDLSYRDEPREQHGRPYLSRIVSHGTAEIVVYGYGLDVAWSPAQAVHA